MAREPTKKFEKTTIFPLFYYLLSFSPSLFFSSKCQKSCFNAVWMEQGTSFVSFYKKMNGSIYVSGFLSCFLWVEYKNQNTIFFLFILFSFFVGQAKQILTYNCIALLWWREILRVVYMGREKGKSEGEENPAKDSLI